MLQRFWCDFSWPSVTRISIKQLNKQLLKKSCVLMSNLLKVMSITFMKVMTRYLNSAGHMNCVLACWSADMILPIMLFALINAMWHWEMWWSCKVKNLETTSENPGEKFFPQFFQWLLSDNWTSFSVLEWEWSGRVSLEKEVKLFSYQQTVISLAC